MLLAAAIVLALLPNMAMAAQDGQSGGTPYENAEKSPAGGVYTISTAEQLKALAEAVNGKIVYGELTDGESSDGESYQNTTFKLTKDIDLSNLCGEEKGVSWTAIGAHTSPDYLGFRGTFDGGGHKITGLYLKIEGRTYQGLFGYVGAGGTVRDLAVDGYVWAPGITAGVVGGNEGTVENCSFSGTVRGGTSVAGVVGHNWGTVRNCYNTGDVDGSFSVAGVVGSNPDGTVTDCYNTGSVAGGMSVAGVAGDNGYGGVVEHCRNAGNVEGNEDVGGIVGLNASPVKNCHNTGNVTGTANVGGVIGNHSLGTLENCYSTGNVTANRAAGGVAGFNSSVSTVQTCYSIGKVICTDSGALGGGVVGWNEKDEGEVLPGGIVKDCYYLAGTAKQGIGDGSGETQEISLQAFAETGTFTGWDFTGTWEMGQDKEGKPTRPLLRGMAEVEKGDIFRDVKQGAWYCEAVTYVAEHGLMAGAGGGMFEPNTPLSRAMIVQILYNLEGKPAVTSKNAFTDVKAGKWYTDAVLWAAEQKIVSGYGNGKFGPNDSVTRQQVVTILHRYTQSKGKNAASGGGLSAFKDGGKTAGWALDAMKWAVSAGIINGKGKGILDPMGGATRAEIAAMVMRYCEKY